MSHDRRPSQNDQEANDLLAFFGPMSKRLHESCSYCPQKLLLLGMVEAGHAAFFMFESRLTRGETGFFPMKKK